MQPKKHKKTNSRPNRDVWTVFVNCAHWRGSTLAIYKTVPIIFPLNLQTITITLDVVKWRGGGLSSVHTTSVTCTSKLSTQASCILPPPLALAGKKLLKYKCTFTSVYWQRTLVQPRCVSELSPSLFSSVPWKHKTASIYACDGYVLEIQRTY